MGSGMAASLLKAGHDVTAYNRSPGQGRRPGRQGARPPDSRGGAAAATSCITMLANDEAVEAVTFGDGGILDVAGAGLRPRLVVSTISVALSARLTARARRRGSAVRRGAGVRASRGGRGGEVVRRRCRRAQRHVETVSPALLDAIGQRTFVVSEEPKAANLVKLSGNFLIAIGHRITGRGNGLGRQGGRRQAGVPRDPDLDPVRRAGLQDLRRAGRAPGVRAGRIRRRARPQGHSPGAGRRRRHCRCRCRSPACCAIAS